MDTASAKSKLRSDVRALRRALSPAHRGAAAFRAARHFIRNRKLSRARRIAVYLAVGSELDTRPLIDALLDAHRQLFVPKVRDAGTMHLVRMRSDTSLRRGRHGIAAPGKLTPRALPRALDVILVPLLAFDAQGRRLGSGGGYYDRLLAQRQGSRPLLVGYAYAMQQLAAVPEEVWDRRLDAVITERGIAWFK